MAKELAAVFTVAMMAGVTGTGGAAQPDADDTVVVHTVDAEHVPARELAEAQSLVAAVYARIGVRLVWTGGNSRLAANDGFRHVDVAILNLAMTERHKMDQSALAFASHTANVAYIFYPRVFAHARRTGSAPALTLALVIGHELGHVLLPDYSHAPSGLMRAYWEGRISDLPDFMPSQAETIRTLLAAQ